MSMHVVFSEKKKVFPPRPTDSVPTGWQYHVCWSIAIPFCLVNSIYLLVCLKRARFSSMQVSQGWFHLNTPRNARFTSESLLRKRVRTKSSPCNGHRQSKFTMYLRYYIYIYVYMYNAYTNLGIYLYISFKYVYLRLHYRYNIYIYMYVCPLTNYCW